MCNDPSQLILRLHTPLGIAILKLFDGLRQSTILHNNPLPAGHVKAYIFGGAAMHIYTSGRYSNDVDIDLNAEVELDADIVVYYEDENKNNSVFTLDTNFNVNFGLIHPDYHDDAIALQQKPDSPLWLYVASPIDLAVSKVARFADVDKKDISLLAERGLVTHQKYTERVNEAPLYLATSNRMLKYNIKGAAKLIQKFSKTDNN